MDDAALRPEVQWALALPWLDEATAHLLREAAALWQNWGRSLAAAADAMRRILVDRAKGVRAAGRGGDGRRAPVGAREAPESPGAAGDWGETACDDLLQLDETLRELGRHDPLAARLVELRYFAALSAGEAAAAAGVSSEIADRRWAFARAWLHARIDRRRCGSG